MQHTDTVIEEQKDFGFSWLQAGETDKTSAEGCNAILKTGIRNLLNLSNRRMWQIR
jgi:hypothetical protein